MEEIGGYLGMEQLVSREYYSDLISLNTGRSCLGYLIQSRKILKIYIPYYLCNSISDYLSRQNCEYEYYHTDYNFMPIFNKILSDYEYIYIVNYFGQISKEQIMELKSVFRNVIVDNTQDFFQKPIRTIDTIYNCRKFFGVADGAYLSTDVFWEGVCEMDVSHFRMKHVLGRYEGSAADYYDEFKRIDKSFANEEIKYMSKITHNIMGAIDYDKVIASRNENFSYLHDRLQIYNRININLPNAPFAYPFLVKNADGIREKLIKKKIYIPILWPNVLNLESSTIEYDIAKNLLPLPCDQRYNLSDMETVLNEVSSLIL